MAQSATCVGSVGNAGKNLARRQARGTGLRCKVRHCAHVDTGSRPSKQCEQKGAGVGTDAVRALVALVLTSCSQTHTPCCHAYMKLSEDWEIPRPRDRMQIALRSSSKRMRNNADCLGLPRGYVGAISAYMGGEGGAWKLTRGYTRATAGLR